jgi:hypothetical protein
MSACKQYQRQLALHSAGALGKCEVSDALAHLNLCSGCHEYWQRLQVVVGLYRQDAERSIPPASGPFLIRSLPRRPLVTWGRAAALAMAAVVLSATVFLLRDQPPEPETVFPVALRSDPISIVSIGDSRRLLNKDFEALSEPSEGPQRPEFVFSIATRREDM